MNTKYKIPDLRKICTKCAEELGGSMHPDHIATWEMGVCDRCREEHVVTEPRDFRLTPDGKKR